MVSYNQVSIHKIPLKVGGHMARAYTLRAVAGVIMAPVQVVAVGHDLNRICFALCDGSGQKKKTDTTYSGNSKERFISSKNQKKYTEADNKITSRHTMSMQNEDLSQWKNNAT